MNACSHNREEARVKTILVDDSPFMLKILAQLLQEAGNFDLIGTASNGCQALRYVSSLSPELVLMDVNMPHLNGIEATRYIKQREHPPKIIITTSDDSAAAKAMAQEAGADGFVKKDGNLRQQMIDVLQELFGPDRVKQTQTRCTSHEKPLVKDVGIKPADLPLVISPVQAASQATESNTTNLSGKRTVPGCAGVGTNRAHRQALGTKRDPSIPPTPRATVRFLTDLGTGKPGHCSIYHKRKSKAMDGKLNANFAQTKL